MGSDPGESMKTRGRRQSLSFSESSNVNLFSVGSTNRASIVASIQASTAGTVASGRRIERTVRVWKRERRAPFTAVCACCQASSGDVSRSTTFAKRPRESKGLIFCLEVLNMLFRGVNRLFLT